MCARAIQAFAGIALAAGFALALPHATEDLILRTPSALLLLCVGIAGVPMWILAHRRLRHSTPPPSRVLPVAFSSAVFLSIGFVVVSPSFHASRVGCLFAAWSTVASAALWRASDKSKKPSRAMLAACSIAVSLLIAELLLRTVAAAWPNPMLATAGTTAQHRFAAYALAPHSERLGMLTNSLGFYDDEFELRNERKRRAIAVVGDSFSASFVPHARHYTTVAERQLADVDLWNVGWPAMGPAEYRAMLEQFVLPRDPDAVVVSVFLGNDLLESAAWSATDAALARWFDRGNLLLYELPRRMLRIFAAPRASESLGAGGDLAGVQQWIDDPLREPGTMSDDMFLRIETERAVANSDPSGPRWESLVRELLAMREACGDRPFGIALIPDESMVEDALHERVVQAHGAPLRRHALRERLNVWCGEQGIACLDFWPVLRSAKPWPADGARHLYLLRDTHWNARGNEVAGQALADFIAARLLR